MKIGPGGVFAAAVLPLSCVPAAAHPPSSAAAVEVKPGGTRGRVIAADTGKPLRRARLSLTPAGGSAWSRPLIANTDASGRFEFKDVPPGSCYIAASRAGYLNVQYGQRRPRELGLAVTLRAGRTIEDLDIALPRGGVLSGRITDELGEPYPGGRGD